MGLLCAVYNYTIIITMVYKDLSTIIINTMVYMRKYLSTIITMV